MAKIYFSHPRASVGTYEEMQIIRELERRGYEVYDPFLEDEMINGAWFERIKDGTFTYHDSSWLVHQDLIAIGKCDAFIAWLPEKTETFGTIIEIGWAGNQAHLMNNMTVIREDGIHPWALIYSLNNLYLSISDWKEGKRCERG